MKFLIAGTWQWPQYEAAYAEALVALGHDVGSFSFAPYFQGRFGRYQEAIPIPARRLIRLNIDLLTEARNGRPEIVLLWRNTHVLPTTVRWLQRLGARVISHNHDDPFSDNGARLAPWHHRFLWLWYRKALRDIEITFVNRQVNVAEARAYGATNVHVLKPHFVPRLHRPMELSAQDRERFECDVVFAGHYEPDGREEYIRTLVAAGVRVRLFGSSYWTPEVLKELSGYFGSVRPVLGDDYAKALCGAKLCLAFLSKLNRDTYTSRCFEIPACGRLLLSERTADLEAMFRDGEEAVFFSSPGELREKVDWLLSRPETIDRIASAGRRRVHGDGHDVGSRVKQLVAVAGEAISPASLAAVQSSIGEPV